MLMMNQKRKKCPLCGNRMKDNHGDLICQECGYRASYESVGMSKTSEAPPNPPGSSSQSPGPNIRFSYNQDHPVSPATSGNTQNTPKKSSVIWIVSLGIIAALFCSVLSVLIPLFMNPDEHSSQTSRHDNNIYDHTVSSYPPKAPSASKKSDTAKAKSFRLPETDMFQQFITYIFHKNYTKVTKKELSDILSINISQNEEDYLIFHYTRKNGETGKFCYNNETIHTSDLVCFPGLTTLKLERISLNKGDLDGLDELISLRCNNSPNELAQIIDPQQLTSLELDADLFLYGLKGIEDFSRLTHLCLHCRNLKDLSALSSLKKLTSLEISEGDSIENFQPLFGLTRLESLAIDSKCLRDIGFIRDMPQLIALSIENSSILQLDALSDCKDTLCKLNLSDNYQVTDYQVIQELNGLTDLTLRISYSFDSPGPLPSFAGMPNLKRLSISGFDDISQLAEAPGLEVLTLNRIYAQDFSVLSSLTKLISLNLLDLSLEPSALEPVLKLQQLKKLNLEDSFIWGNVQQLLELPNLKEFNMNHCTAGFDMSAAPANSELEILHMSHVTLKSLVSGKWDYNANNENNISLDSHTDLFQNYPNLQELYLAEHKLSDLSFVQNLKELQILDITNNYVTSLTPLADLSFLEAVMCAVNPIAEDGGLGHKILNKN